ncbi:MAG: recombination protein RecR [Deltaproteobacteria bacterium]|nr:recombination protein RecR [Deltaproteobacteria bacterium]
MADPLAQLIQHLGKLPGIGERTATRLAFFILRGPTSYAHDLANALIEVKQRLRQCSQCCQLTEQDPCSICNDAKRDRKTILVVALPQDLLAIERTGGYRGTYHVLHGLLSPLDGIGPDELKIDALLARLKDDDAVKEIILATSPNVEGDATALYLSRLLKPLGYTVSRIASGVPIGGELEYADSVTLNRAIEGRHEV